MIEIKKMLKEIQQKSDAELAAAMRSTVDDVLSLTKESGLDAVDTVSALNVAAKLFAYVTQKANAGVVTLEIEDRKITVEKAEK